MPHVFTTENLLAIKDKQIVCILIGGNISEVQKTPNDRYAVINSLTTLFDRQIKSFSSGIHRNHKKT